MEKTFKEKVYELVNSIPDGCVLSYGTVAALCGKPGNARQIGRMMTESPGDVRSYRVVHGDGGTCPGWEEQKKLLIADGVSFKPNGKVDMKKHLWKIS